MTDEQIHLYAVARTVIPIGTLLSTIAEPVKGNGTLYTLVTHSGDHLRWFAVHSSTLRNVDDDQLRHHIAAAFS